MGESMNQIRVYTMKVIATMFREAELHGRYTDILKREGIQPIVLGGVKYFNADAVDSFLAMVKL